MNKLSSNMFSTELNVFANKILQEADIFFRTDVSKFMKYLDNKQIEARLERYDYIVELIALGTNIEKYRQQCLGVTQRFEYNFASILKYINWFRLSNDGQDDSMSKIWLTYFFSIDEQSLASLLRKVHGFAQYIEEQNNTVLGRKFIFENEKQVNCLI